MRILITIAITLLLAIANLHASDTFILNDRDQTIIGEYQSYTIKEKESLIELARDFNIGYNEIVAANYNIDPWVPDNGAEILIPTKWLLPYVLDDGIVINLAEMRLYHFTTLNGSKYVKTYPLGIGAEGSRTPTGTFKITGKVKDPIWKVPDSIKKEKPELPDFVHPGPDNPLGGYWLQLSINGYGIHGTNRPYGIGRRVSHGCLRLYPEDIKVLFDLVKSGTTVKIVNEPVKAGLHEGKVYIEVDCPEEELSELLSLATKNLSRKNLLNKVDTQLLIQAVRSATGLPALISK